MNAILVSKPVVVVAGRPSGAENQPADSVTDPIQVGLQKMFVAFGLALCCGAMAGCVTGEPRRSGPSIQRVVAMYELVPWLNLDPQRDAKPEGFSFYMYLFSQQTRRGVHREGTLHIDIYRRERRGERDSIRLLVDTWTYPTSDIHRSATPNSRFGDFYRVRLSWMPYDLSGTELEVEVRFVDISGRTTHAAHKKLLVPRFAFR